MPWEERIDQRDVRHLPANLTVVLLANRLDRAPDIIRRDDDGGSLVVKAPHAEQSALLAWQVRTAAIPGLGYPAGSQAGGSTGPGQELVR